MQNTDPALRKYPVATKPETWPLNDIYLNIMQEKLEYWEERGYSWKFGQEIEFTPKAFRRYKNKDYAAELTPDELAQKEPVSKMSCNILNN